MYKIPENTEIFEIDKLPGQLSEIEKYEYIENSIEERLEQLLRPYDSLFESEEFIFDDGLDSLSEEINGSLSPIPPFLFDETMEEAPNAANAYVCNSFIALKGTPYERLLDKDKRLVADEPESFGNELEYAENHDDVNWVYVREDADWDSLERIVNCYQKAAEDGVLDAYWCLGCFFDGAGSHYYDEDTFGLAYHYYMKAIELGHLCSIQAIANRLETDKRWEESFKLTYVGAMKKEVFCMWRLAFHYLTGLYVGQSKDKAIALYKQIIETFESEDEADVAFVKKNYSRIREYEINELLEGARHNLQIILGTDQQWEKYFDMKNIVAYNRANDRLLRESCYGWVSEDGVEDRLKELMAEEL